MRKDLIPWAMRQTVSEHLMPNATPTVHVEWQSPNAGELKYGTGGDWPMRGA